MKAHKIIGKKITKVNQIRYSRDGWGVSEGRGYNVLSIELEGGWAIQLMVDEIDEENLSISRKELEKERDVKYFTSQTTGPYGISGYITKDNK
jgi:hypothetical protein